MSRWVALSPTIAAAVLIVVYAAISIRRHQLLLTTGYDLGIFEQEVRS